MSSSGKDPVVSRIKEYITPGLITILGVMLWAELSELKTDVKTLLARDAASTMKIDMLEKEIDRVRQQVCNTTKPISYKNPIPIPWYKMIAKKEDELEVPKPKEKSI
jgi:hypothetical protein